jgi:branched-chain amino acid transport system ATP-binding protein
MLEVSSIDVYYGEVQALRSVNLTVGDGERVALVGANGAGKTTTLRTISGLLSPRSGTVTFDGERIDGQPAWEVVRRGVAHLPEGRDLFAELSVYENLKLGYWPQRRRRGGLRTQMDEVMGHFPILAERSGQMAGKLSGGEQQMLGVARALMSRPKLIVIDELSLGLAPRIVEQIFAILAEINAEGAAVLLVEQFVHMALGGTDRAYVLTKGLVALEGKSSELLDDPALIASYLGGEAAGSSNGHSKPKAVKAATRATPRRARTRA